ncbi:hypothetical protein B0H13DRAFT_1872711 [Mycena leptocephala]|nr:hypothetical protein B0H13DRAFT_1872711 [Mycena leptocephala]
MLKKNGQGELGLEVRVCRTVVLKQMRRLCETAVGLGLGLGLGLGWAGLGVGLVMISINLIASKYTKYGYTRGITGTGAAGVGFDLKEGIRIGRNEFRRMQAQRGKGSLKTCFQSVFGQRCCQTWPYTVCQTRCPGIWLCCAHLHCPSCCMHQLQIWIYCFCLGSQLTQCTQSLGSTPTHPRPNWDPMSGILLIRQVTLEQSN